MGCKHKIYYKRVFLTCNECGTVRDEPDAGEGNVIGDGRYNDCASCNGETTVTKLTWRCDECGEDMG